MHSSVRKILVRIGINREDFSVAFSLSDIPEIEQFVAREDELAEIHRMLRGDGSHRTVVLHAYGSFHLTASNKRMNFRPSFFGSGHTLIIRISGSSFFGMAIQRTQSGYVN